MRSATSDRVENGPLPPVPAGSWRVDPARSSASFTSRVAGRSVRGLLPLSGAAYVSPAVEDSSAELYAETGALRTGSAVLDRVLASPGFLDAETHPRIGFRSEMLVCVPTGWRALGQLWVKGTEHPLMCELDADLRHQQPGRPAMIITTRWVIDPTWITTQRVPMLSGRVAMNCSVTLEQVDEVNAEGLGAAA